MRPSKFRFPDRTAVTAKSESLTALLISIGSGPELPIQVTHP